MLYLLSSFIVSLVLVKIIIATSVHHSHLSHDDDLSAIQKYHSISTPRIGGVAIYMAFLCGVIFLHFFCSYDDSFALKILQSGSIVFVIGLLEDITQKITPKMRLITFCIATFVAIYIVNSMPIIYSTDFIALNNLIMKYKIIGIAFSLFAVVGLVNSYNIIDGYNGLSATTAIINLIALAVVGYLLADLLVVHTIFCLIGAIAGFLLFNYPSGKIFLGDGGAYLIGFIIANVCIYLAHTHIGQVSPYVFLLINIYPITEIGFSIFRRKLIHKTKSTAPDNKHLHQLVYHKIITPKIHNKNAAVVLIMLFFIVPQVILSCIFYKDTTMCLVLIGLYVIYYAACYSVIARLKDINS